MGSSYNTRHRFQGGEAHVLQAALTAYERSVPTTLGQLESGPYRVARPRMTRNDARCPGTSPRFKIGTCSCARPSSHIAQIAQLMPISNTSTRSKSIIRPRSQSNQALLRPFQPHSCHQRQAYSTKRSWAAGKLESKYQITGRRPLRGSL